MAKLFDCYSADTQQFILNFINEVYPPKSLPKYVNREMLIDEIKHVVAEYLELEVQDAEWQDEPEQASMYGIFKNLAFVAPFRFDGCDFEIEEYGGSFSDITPEVYKDVKKFTRKRTQY